jgi:hypothetical protein
MTLARIDQKDAAGRSGLPSASISIGLRTLFNQSDHKVIVSVIGKTMSNKASMQRLYAMQIWAPKIARPFVAFSAVYDTSPGAHEK